MPLSLALSCSKAAGANASLRTELGQPRRLEFPAKYVIISISAWRVFIPYTLLVAVILFGRRSEPCPRYAQFDEHDCRNPSLAVCGMCWYWTCHAKPFCFSCVSLFRGRNKPHRSRTVLSHDRKQHANCYTPEMIFRYYFCQDRGGHTLRKQWFRKDVDIFSIHNIARRLHFLRCQENLLENSSGGECYPACWRVL